MTSWAFFQNTATDLFHRMNETDIFYVSTSLPGAVQVISCIYLTIIFLFSVPANIGIFVLFFKSPVIQTPFNFLLMNLIFTELIMALYGLPIDFIAAYTNGWKMGKGMCEATGFILSASGETSIITLAALSFQRYLTTKNSSKYIVSTYKASFFIIFGIWSYSLGISLPPFFGIGAYTVESSGMTCAPDWQSNNHLVYTMYWLIIGFLCPLGIILLSSCKTVIHCVKQRRSYSNDEVKRKSLQRESRIFRLVILMNLAFLTCWLPYAVIALCYIFGYKASVVVLPLMTAKSSVCWNPILYVALNRQFRGAFRRLFKSRNEKELEQRWIRINKCGPKSMVWVRTPRKTEKLSAKKNLLHQISSKNDIEIAPIKRTTALHNLKAEVSEH